MKTLNREVSGKPIRGQISPGIGYLYVMLIMFLAVAIGTLLSGGFIPVDPNGPYGPPTLPLYYGTNGEDAQEIIWNKNATPNYDKELQLKTFKVNTCASTAVINLLIDTSASMQDDNKIYILRDGLTALIKKMSPSAVVGIQTFSAVVQERVPLDYLSKNRVAVNANISSLNADGWTRLKNGVEMATQKLAEAINTKKFPGYKYYLVILSDGVPEIPKTQSPRTCVNPPGIVNDPLWCDGQNCAPGEGRCFTLEQDPRYPDYLIRSLRNLGVEVYTVGIFSKSAVSDQIMRPYLESLLSDISTPPAGSHYFAADFDNINLEEILKRLTSTICEENIGGEVSPNPSRNPNYPFPTFPSNATHVPYTPPGGQFTP